MKKQILALFLVITMALGLTPAAAAVETADIPLDEAHFPDKNFRENLTDMLDSNHDGILSAAEQQVSGRLILDHCKIHDLTGLEYLTGLTELCCECNHLTELDVSQNKKLKTLKCGGNELTTLNFGDKPDLISLYCSFNQLTDLNVTQCPELTDLNCKRNHLRKLDVSQNTLLSELDCSDNRLETLNLRANTGLKKLSCNFNSLACLDLTANSALEFCSCKTNRALGTEGGLLKDLPGAPALERISNVRGGSFEDGKISFAEGSKEILYNYELMPGKTEAFVLFRDRPAVSIDEAHFPDAVFRAWVAKNLDSDHDNALSCKEMEHVHIVEVDEMKIKDLKGLEYFPNLDFLDCSDNQLTQLDLSKNPKLLELNCEENQITRLELGACPLVERLDCSGCPLGTLDVSSNGRLTELYCTSCGLAALNLSQNEKLTEVFCENNRLTELDLSQNPELKKLDCSLNGILKLNLTQNAVLDYLNCSDNCLGTLDLATCPVIRNVWCCRNGLTTLKLGPTTGMYYLNCNGNYLTGLEAPAKCQMYGTDNYYMVADGMFLEDLPGTPQPEKISDVSGGSVLSGKIIFDPESTEIHYSYDAGNEFTLLKCCLIKPGPEIPIDDAHFPDPNFKVWVSRIADKDGNGKLSEIERKTYTDINLCESGLNDLTGIENFSNLTKLNCSKNQIKKLDCSEVPGILTIECSENPMTELKLTGCDRLEALKCNDTALTSLDLTPCTNLRSVDISDGQLEEIRLPAGANLKTLYCSNNRLKVLDLSSSTGLSSLHAESNALTALDGTACPNLAVSCENNFYTISDEKDLQDLPGKPDPARISSVTGGNFNGGKITFDPASILITYDYQVTESYTVTFGLKAPMEEADEHFVDISRESWYFEAVNYAFQHRLFGGTGEDTFEPETPMTRGMLVTVLWRMEGEPAEGENNFGDVPADEWYTPAVAWAAHNKIVNGVGNNCFEPETSITREQMAAILYRYANWKGIKTEKRGDLSIFPDASQVSTDWALEPVQWAVGEGLINGSDGKLVPQGNATRAQVATILMRFIQNIAEKTPV